MSQLLTNLINFAKKYHYTKEEKPAKYTEWLISKYNNGRLFSRYRTIVDQKALGGSGGTNKCGLRYASSSDTYYTLLYYWYPATKHSNQKAKIKFVNGSHSGTLNNQNLLNDKTVYSSTTLSRCKKGTVTVTIPPYLDEENEIYYTGVTYSVTFSSLTTTIKYFTVKYEE